MWLSHKSVTIFNGWDDYVPSLNLLTKILWMGWSHQLDWLLVDWKINEKQTRRFEDAQIQIGCANVTTACSCSPLNMFRPTLSQMPVRFLAKFSRLGQKDVHPAVYSCFFHWLSGGLFSGGASRSRASCPGATGHRLRESYGSAVGAPSCRIFVENEGELVQKVVKELLQVAICLQCPVLLAKQTVRPVF